MQHELIDGRCVTCETARARPDNHTHTLDDGICTTCADREPLDEPTSALVQALDELDGITRAWEPGKHPRGPDGRFLSIVTRLKGAIQDHRSGKGGAHPFDGYTREQLRRAAKARGLNITRGESRDSISAKLLGHLDPLTPDRKALPTPGPTPTHHDPVVQAALDTVYGGHPKAGTTAHQLATYSAMRRAHFDQLGPGEQSTVLGDLSYIATTSKSATTKAKAEKLLDRFTPPGTAHGHTPAQAVHVPAGAVSGQTRLPDPHGTSGLLVMRDAHDRGANGDGWFRLPGGGTGPWGQYGAAGVMLRHVSPDGTERYLMVQRGPAISDPGKWQFPGGAIDSKENAYEGAARETVEELGLDPNDIAAARVHGYHESSLAGGAWKYTSVAATVDKQLVPDLSTHHARAETSDAKWMTKDEIAALDRRGELLKPLAGGTLQTNVMSLFPPTPAARPGPLTSRPARLVAPPKLAHKPSKGTDLLSDQTAIDKIRQDVKHARVQYAGKVADDRLAAIGALQGFDDTPTVLPKNEVDRLLATGDYTEVWRGVRGAGSYGLGGSGRGGGAISATKTAEQINEEMRSGPAYYGRGIFGNGYYLATQKSVAQQYSDGTKNSLARILVPNSANVVDHADAVSGAARIAKPRSKAIGKKHEDATLWDEGRYAAAKGHDGIRIEYSSQPRSFGGAGHVASRGKPAFNWLNRSVLIVQEADA